MSKLDLGRRALRAGLLAAVSAFAVNSAHATLVNSIPGGTVVTPPNNGGSSTSFFSSTGPFQIGTGVGRDIVWTSNNPSAVGGYSGGYSLCSNGNWTGSPPYFGTNSVKNADTMTFTFNDGDVSSVGGFMSWGRGCFSSVNFTIEARNASNSLLESYSFNFATSGATNSGEFWAIERATADIRSFVVYGSFVILRNLTFLGPTGCPVGAGTDSCLIDSATDQTTAIDAAGGTDELELGGAANFSFALGALGTTYTNFEDLKKSGSSTVTLTGTGAVPGSLKNTQGVLTLAAGAHVSAATITNSAGATLNVGVGATLQGTGNTLNNAGVLNVATNGSVVDAGDINNLATGTINFNGPGGTATLSTGGTVFNDGQINQNSGDVTVTGNITNQGVGVININAGAMTGAGAFTNNSSAIYGVSIAAGASLGAATVVNGAAGHFANSGSITTTGGLSNSGQFVNFANSSVSGGATNLSGQFVNSLNAFVSGGVSNSATFANNGTVNGGVINNAGAGFTNNATGIVNGATSNAGQIINLGSMTGSVTNTAALALFQNQGSMGGVINNAGTVILQAGGNLNGNTISNTGTLSVQGATANIGAVTQIAPGFTSLLANATFGSFGGAGALDLGANTLTTGGNNASTSFTGTTSGAGGITKVGTGKFSTLALANTGTNTINAGEWNINGNVAGNMVVNAGGTLSGSQTIAGNLTLNAGGTLKTGNSPGVTNVAGNFIGGGVMSVEVQFNNAGAPVNGTTHDFLNITGSASNVTTLSIVPFAPSNAPVATTGNGIELVRVGGATSAGAFVLSGPVIQGGFQYLLNYVADYSGANDGYFLKSAAIQEVSLNAALNAASRASTMACSDRNHGHPGLDGAKGRFWADSSDDNLSSGAANGVDFDADTNCYRAGVTAQAGGNLQVGIAGGMSSSSVDANLAQGLATMDGDGIAIKAEAAYVKGQMFVEGALGYASTDWSIVKAAGAGVAGATIDGLTGHVGAGYRTSVFGPIMATLSASVDYDGTSCGSGCLIAGATEELSNWSAGVHARFDAAFSNGRIRPYAQFGLTTDLDGGTSASFGGASTSVDAMSGLAHADLGLEANVWKSLSIYAQGGVIEGLDSETSGHSGKIGAKITW